MVPGLTAVASLAGDQALIPSTNMVANNHP